MYTYARQTCLTAAQCLTHDIVIVNMNSTRQMHPRFSFWFQLTGIFVNHDTDAAKRSDGPDYLGLPLNFLDQVQLSSVSELPGVVVGARGDWTPAWWGFPWGTAGVWPPPTEVPRGHLQEKIQIYSINSSQSCSNHKPGIYITLKTCFMTFIPSQLIYILHIYFVNWQQANSNTFINASLQNDGRIYALQGWNTNTAREKCWLGKQLYIKSKYNPVFYLNTFLWVLIHTHTQLWEQSCVV